MKPRKWQSLEPGDIVDIVAPGMKSEKATLKNATRFLKEWGLKARISSDMMGKDLICSHSKDYRFKDLKKAILAKDSKMIWCVRGGYGSHQLLPALAKLKEPKTCKIFLGLSDNSSLHDFFNQRWNWATLHGPHVDKFANGLASGAEARRLRRIIFGEVDKVSYRMKPLNSLATKKANVKGRIGGGNMVTLQSSFGTLFEMKTQNSILFFEEIGERAYKIDRILEHMGQLGLFKKVKAVLFGQMTGGQEPNGKNLVPLLLKQWASRQKFPVFGGLKSGHGPNQHPIPFGTRAQIQGGETPQIFIPTGVES